MSSSTVAVVGSGIAGASIAYTLAQRGYDVVVFEKGPEYPYPHSQQFVEQIHYLYDNPKFHSPADIERITVSGSYPYSLNDERKVMVGGTATHWNAVTPRIHPEDFRTKTLHGLGEDWPLEYEDLEEYYCKAEALLGVSGTDSDNPFAPWRSKSYPLGQFDLSHDDQILAERLNNNGIVLHTTPQARTRRPYEGRPGCRNHGTCRYCPIGVRYSPNYHLQLAERTGRCTILSNTSVRRIEVDKTGTAHSLIFQQNDAESSDVHDAKVIIVATGAFETPRLLLLSANDRYPDGLGNNSGHLGQHLTFHPLYHGGLHFKRPLHHNSVGPFTGLCDQFLRPSDRYKHGGFKIFFSSLWGRLTWPGGPDTTEEILEVGRDAAYWRPITFHCDSLDSPQKYVTLGEEKDRFGDPFAHVHYDPAEYDYSTYESAKIVLAQFAEAAVADDMNFSQVDRYAQGNHHMGSSRMSHDEKDGVADPFGKVHNTNNLFLAGSGLFVTSTPTPPTLTIAALALRTADYITEQLL